MKNVIVPAFTKTAFKDGAFFSQKNRFGSSGMEIPFKNKGEHAPEDPD